MEATAEVNPFEPSKPYFACDDQVGMAFFEGATERFQYDVELDVSPTELFAIFEDPEAWPAWCPGIHSVEWTSPKPYGVGTTRIVRMKGKMDVYERFIDWEPGERMAFVLEGATQDTYWAFGERYEVEALEGGRARLRWTVAYDPRGSFAKAHFIVRPLMRLTLGWFMRRLGRFCQARARA